MRRARSSASDSGTPGAAAGATGGGVCMAAMHVSDDRAKDQQPQHAA